MPPLTILPYSGTVQGQLSSGFPPHPTFRCKASAFSLVSGTGCGKEGVNNIPPLRLRIGSGARETNIVQDKELLWKNVLLACHRMMSPIHTSCLLRSTQRKVPYYTEKMKGPYFTVTTCTWPGVNPTFPRHHPRVAPTNSQHHSAFTFVISAEFMCSSFFHTSEK